MGGQMTWTDEAIKHWKETRPAAGGEAEALEIINDLEAKLRQVNTVLALVAEDTIYLANEIEKAKPVDQTVKRWVIAAKKAAEYALAKMLGPIEDYANLMTIEEFTSRVKDGSFVDYDGIGYYATEKAVSRLSARPSRIAQGDINNEFEFTHVAWFNK